MIDQRTGSLLWTHFGISGPVVMDASRFWTLAHEAGESRGAVREFFARAERRSRRSRWFLDQAAGQSSTLTAKTLAQLFRNDLPKRLSFHVDAIHRMPIAQLPRK